MINKHHFVVGRINYFILVDAAASVVMGRSGYSWMLVVLYFVLVELYEMESCDYLFFRVVTQWQYMCPNF